MKAQESYQAGKLADAITYATTAVREKPTDTGARYFLCEMLLFAGEWERIDKQLDTILTQDPDAALGVSLFRQLLRSEVSRQQFFAEGRMPELLGQPSPAIQLFLQASILLREGKKSEANKLLADAEEQRPHPKGTCDGKPFEDLRDCDDLTASVLEVLTTTGKYYWVPYDRVVVLEFRPPTRPRDLVWRRAHLEVSDGPDGEVYIPALYVGSHASTDDQLRLGRATEWTGGDGAPTRGIGQRSYLVGEEGRAIMELQTATFEVAESK